MPTVYEHVFMVIGGVECKDYTLIDFENRCFWPRRYKRMGTSFNLLVDKTFHNRLRTLDNLVDDTIYPAEGSEVHMVPDSIYSMNDVRQHYKIKRSVDTGDYNVFSPVSKSNQMSLYSEVQLVYHSLKKIFFFSKNTTKQTAINEAHLYDAETVKSTGTFLSGSFYSVYKFALNESYLGLLNGTLEKPCVRDTHLSLSSDNNLTVEQLMSIYHLGKDYSYFNQKDLENLKIEMNALNQYNWRKYPGSINLVLSGICKLDKKINKSDMSKPMRELLGCKSEFVSEEDLNLGIRFMDDFLHIGNCRFSSFDALQKKLASIEIPYSIFARLFDVAMKITPKKYEQESNN